MGSETFLVSARGKTAQEAFNNATRQARFESGHGGYSGTIGEKHSFVMITKPAGISPADYAYKLIDDDDKRIVDKWGPAGCIQIAPGEFLFFGWASS